jgi:LysM repeat protein
MASQQAIQPLGFEDPSHVRAAAHDVRVYLVRLILIAALTGVVVGVWATQDDAAPTATALSTSDLSDEADASSTITAPAAEQRGTAAPPSIAAGPAVVPQPNAIPRPPERAEPQTPAEFVRFTVAPADTVFDISVVYGVSIAEILLYNPNLGDGSQVDVGQLIFVPVYEPSEEEAAADE